VLTIATRSWFLFGGAISVFIVALKHWRLAVKQLP